MKTSILDTFAVPHLCVHASLRDVTIDIHSGGGKGFYVVYDETTRKCLGSGYAPSLRDAIRIAWEAAGWTGEFNFEAFEKGIR